MDFEAGNKERDRALRRRILIALDAAMRFFAGGKIDGVTLRDNVNVDLPDPQRFEDDHHAMALMQDLANRGLIEIKHLPRRIGERPSLARMRLKITASGTDKLLSNQPDQQIASEWTEGEE
jgi:hypothetical protein